MELGGLYKGCIGRMEIKWKNALVYCGYIGIMEKKMETSIVHRGYSGRMEIKWKLSNKWVCNLRLRVICCQAHAFGVVYMGVYPGHCDMILKIYP